MQKKKSYPIKRESETSIVFVCGGLNFDAKLNQLWSNKGKGYVFIKQNSHNRKLLYALMSSQGKLFSYDELMSVLYADSNKGAPESAAGRKKFVNDKIDALKKKLAGIGFERKDLRKMFICDGGYRLVPPRIGKKRLSKGSR